MRVCANMRVCAGVHDARVVAALVGSLAVDMCTVGIETKNRDSRRVHCRQKIVKLKLTARICDVARGCDGKACRP